MIQYYKQSQTISSTLERHFSFGHISNWKLFVKDHNKRASLVAQLVKNPTAMQETCWEDTLEKGKATHSSILAWRIPWTIYIVHGVAKSQTGLSDFHFHNKRRWAYTLLDHASSTFCETDSLQNTAIKKKKKKKKKFRPTQSICYW